MLLGEISPKISTTTVTTTVETVAPMSSPNSLTNISVPREAARMFTMLLPISIVEMSLS